ncbi:Cobalamin (vitamin B12)-binding domain protein, partial [Candidatus Magnetomorum sp. HK-1]
MKILLINPPWYRLQNLVSTYPPMGALYIAGILEKNGYECVVWNADYCDKSYSVTEGSSTINMHNMSKLHKQYLDLLNNLNSPIWQEVKQVIKSQQPDVIGLLTYTSSLASVKNIAQISKQINKNIIVICGGPHATIAPLDLIEDKNVDYVIKGEGETTTLNLLNNINNSKKFSEIKGLYYKNCNEIFFT